MLKNIPSVLSPFFMKILMEMGHGDELCIADGNFPAASLAQRLVRLDGHGIPPIIDAVMRFFPLDHRVERAVYLMEVPSNRGPRPSIWQEYDRIICTHEPAFSEFEHLERYEYYRRAERCYAIAATSEAALFANIILKKGVIEN